MPIDLTTFAAPAHSAVLCIEMQKGIVGGSGHLPGLAAAVAENRTVEHCARLLQAAREAKVPVVFCTVQQRPDGAGTRANSPLLARRPPGHTTFPLMGTEEAAPLAALHTAESDIVCSRTHGFSAFTGTELDSILRNLGVQTVILCGVSVNVAMITNSSEAVSLGYNVIVVTDAVAGFPAEHVASVMQHTIAPLASRVLVDDVVAAWRQG